MRLAITVVSPAARQTADVLLDADPATPVAGIAAQLERFMHGTALGADGARVVRFPGPRAQGSLAVADPFGQPSAVPLYVDCRQVPPEAALADSAIIDGAVISIGGPEGCLFPEPVGLVEVRVTGGPDAGAVHRLSLGEASVGSGQRVAIAVHDPALPEFALRVAVDRRGHCQVAPYDGVRATLDREPLLAAAQWEPGQQIAAGDTLLVRREAEQGVPDG